MKYWRALFGDDPADKLEVRGYRDASTSTQETQAAALLRTSAAQLLRAAEGVSDPAEREVLREAALARGHHRYLVVGGLHQLRDPAVGRRGERVPVLQRPSRLYLRRFRGERGRADQRRPATGSIAPVRSRTTKPRVGDLICQQREPALADASDEAVRERIRAELGGSADARSVRRTHCEVVAYVDARARKMYTIGGNVNQAVTARKLNLRRGLKFSAVAKGPLRRRGPLDPAAVRRRQAQRRIAPKNARSTTRNGSCCCS